MGQPVVFTCEMEKEEYLRVKDHPYGALIEMHSPSQVNMGETPSVVLNDLEIANMIYTLKCIQKERNIYA